MIYISGYWAPVYMASGQYHQNAPTHLGKPNSPSIGESFKCPNCNRMYMRLSCLKRHLKVECGKAPKYQCQICYGWFKYKHNLSAHLQLHMEQPKFPCSLCPKKFYRRDKLVDHEKKYHPTSKAQSSFSKTDTNL